MRRAQFSLEFMLTYGWVLLIIFGALVVVYTTGVFSFADFLPETCTFFGQIRCSEAQLISAVPDTAAFKVKVVNGFGVDLILYNATLSDGKSINCTGLPQNNVQWPVDSTVQLNVTTCVGDDLDDDIRVTGDVIVTFYRNNTWCDPDPTGCLYTSMGEIKTKVR